MKNNQNLIKIEETCVRGYPQGGKQIEFAAKMAQDASKSGFEEALEALGGALGGPKGSQEGPKSKLGGFFCEVEKARV